MPTVQRSVAKQLDRKLGFPAVFSISVGAMMATGVFVLPGLAAGIAGPWVCAAYAIAALLVLPATLSKAELATAMPVAGGTYVYVDRSMGPWMGTIAGLGTWLAQCAKTAIAFVGLGIYLILFTDVPPAPFSLSVLALLLLVNWVGVGKASGLQVAIVAVCIAALGAFVAVGAPQVQPAHFTPPLPNGAGGLFAAAGFLFVSYSGVTKVCAIAEEIKQPERNIPLGMIAGLLGVTVIYVAVTAVLVGVVPHTELATDETPIATAAAIVFGPTGKAIFGGVAVVALISLCNAGILATARFPFAMARDRVLPDVLRKVSGRFGTPTAALALTGLVLLVLITTLPVMKLAKLASGFKIFVFCMANVAVIVLRETGPRWYRPSFRSPLYPWLQVFGILGGIVVLVGLGGLATGGVVGMILLGTAWYLYYARARVDRRSAFAHLFGEIRAVRAADAADAADDEEDRHTLENKVLVPLFGGEPSTARLMQLAGEISPRRMVEVVRLEEIPEQLNLGAMLDRDSDMQRMLEEAARIADDLVIDVQFRDVVTHNAKAALLQQARGGLAEWIVLGRPARRGLRALVRDPMAWWLDHAPCDLAIFNDKAPHLPPRFDKILAFAEPGPYDSMVSGVADLLATRGGEGRVTFILPVAEDTDEETMAALRAYHQELRALCRGPSSSLIVKTSDAARTVMELSSDADLLVFGAPAERGWRSVLLGSYESELEDVSRCSTLRLKSPRDGVHERLPHMGIDTTTLDMPAFLEAGVVAAKLPAATQADLFALVAGSVADAGVGIDPAELEAALWAREKLQTTATSEGVSLSAPVLLGVASTVLAVVTTAAPVEFDAGNRPVDVCIVVVAPPGRRTTQLRLIERLTRALDRTNLLPRLRGAATPEEVRLAVTNASRSAIVLSA